MLGPLKQLHSGDIGKSIDALHMLAANYFDAVIFYEDLKDKTHKNYECFVLKRYQNYAMDNIYSSEYWKLQLKSLYIQEVEERRIDFMKEKLPTYCPKTSDEYLKEILESSK